MNALLFTRSLLLYSSDPSEGVYRMDKPNVPTLPNVPTVQFLKEVASELKKVSWPTREETIKLTAVVIAISLLVAAFIGGLDFAFLKITSLLFRR